MGPGLGAALLWCALFGLEGAERGVLLVTGVLPSAVMNFVLTEAYGESGEEVASAILLGTLLAFIAIPAVLGLVV
jgi:predicted permease